MKKVILGLIATVMISVSGFASDLKLKDNLIAEISEMENTNLGVLTLKSGDVIAEYKFKSVEDFSKFSDSILESFIADLTDECSITITMSVTVKANVGIGIAGGEISTTVTGSITASCSDAVAAGKKLKDKLVEIANS